MHFATTSLHDLTASSHPTTVARRLTLGIALGSGSARGWAHVGVLRALTEQGIVPDCVAGSSMGAIVGAAFAAGRLEQLESWALSLDWRRLVGLLDVGLRGGLIKGDRLLEVFHGELVACQFSELPVRFAAVATDLASGQEVWLREGKVSEAIRASCTVPGLFRPVLHEGRYLVDGGIVNPVPVSLCRAMGADVVIAGDLNSDTMGRFARDNAVASTTSPDRPALLRALLPRRRDSLRASDDGDVPPQPSMIEALLGAVDVMQVRIARSRLAGEPPDVLLSPRLGYLGLFEYHRAAVAITEGREVVARMLPAIRHALAT